MNPLNPARSVSSLLSSLPAQARILIVRLRSIGDIVLLTPALRLVKDWRPDLRLSVVLESRFRELLQGNPNVEEILDPGEGRGWSKVASRLHVIQEVRGRRFALCLNLHGGPTSAFLTQASGAKQKAGFAHFRRQRIYSILIPDARDILNQSGVHTVEHQAAAFFYLGLPRREVPRAELFVNPHHEFWWRERRAALGLGEKQEYALLHPTALYPSKQWAPEKFAQLGRYLESEVKLPPLYACGPGESRVLDEIARAAGTRIARLEGVRLGQYAAVLARARLFVGNDSGPAHMAAALARPSVVIFGSSSSAIWGPWRRSGEASVVQNSFECNPCPGDRCYRFARPECILSVSFDQVREAVEAVLEKTRGT